MSTQHTPGPWHFVEKNVGAMPDHGYCLLHGEPAEFGWEKNLFVVVGASGNAVRALGEGVPEANAKLIAAAPELLEALQEIVRNWDGEPEDMAAANAAISKATR